MKQYMDIIKNIPLFKTIDDKEISELAKCLDIKIKQFKKNSIIFEEGEVPKYICAVLSGNVIISHNDYHGNRSIVSTITAPNIFSEAFACSGTGTMPVSVTSSDESTIMFIDKNKLLDPCGNKCDFHNRLIQNLIVILANKNLLLNQKLEVLSKRTTKEKLLTYLSGESKKHNSKEFTIPYDRQALADYLGVERSAMSSEISKLKKSGLIESNRSRFKLLF